MKVSALANLIFKPHRIIASLQSIRHTYEKHGYDYQEIDGCSYQGLEIESKHGYTLKGKWYKKNENQKLIILVHGYAGIAREMELIAPFFLKMGFDVVTYGVYAYGQKTALVTFGNHESDDLARIIKGILKTKKYETYGLYGHSLGANTVLKVAGKLKRQPDFIIANAPFNKLEEVLIVHLNTWFGGIIQLGTLQKLAWEIMQYAGDTWGKDVLLRMTTTAKLSMPVLYLHGDADKLNPPYMSEQLQQVTPHATRVLLPGAGHLNTFTKTRVEIEQAIKTFLQTIDIIEKEGLK